MRLDLAKCIREELSEQRLPQWVVDIFNLDAMSKFSDLPASLEVNSIAELKAMNHYVQSLVNRRLRDGYLQSKQCFPYSPLVLDKTLINSLELSVRTRNALISKLSDDREALLSEITYGNLFKTPNMGAKSVLEFLYKASEYGLNAESKSSDSENENDLILNKSIESYISKLKNLDDIDCIYKGDPRFSEINVILPVAEYEKGNSLSELLSQSHNSFSEWPRGDRHRFNELLKATYEKIKAMETSSIEEMFRELIKSFYSVKEINVYALYNRFGINNEGIKTLEECGQEAGITRERIRQLESIVIKGIRATPGEDYIYMPKLARAIDIIRKNIGLSVVDIKNIFIDEGISDIGISVYAVLNFGELLRYSVTDLRITNVKDSKEKVVTGSDININSIFVELTKLHSKNGIADLHLVESLLDNKRTLPNYDEITNLVSSSKQWQSIDDNKRWWLPVNLKQISRNRLINVARKVLSVNESINVEDFRNGFIKLANFRNSSNSVYKNNNITVPSAEAILGFFNLIDDFTVNERNISSNLNLDYKKELGEVEWAIADVLIKSPTGIMTRSELFKGVTNLGIKENSANIYISYSSVVQHIGLDTYTIIGKKPLASDYSAHQDAVSDKNKNKNKRILLCDWDAGLIRIVIRCPEITATLVVGSPSSVKPLLANRTFEVWDKNETKQFANIGVNESGSIYGMSSFCRQSGVEENDILVMRFNLLSSKAYLSLGTVDEYLDFM